VVDRAYEQTGLIVTTNLPFEQWHEPFGFFPRQNRAARHKRCGAVQADVCDEVASASGVSSGHFFCAALILAQRALLPALMGERGLQLREPAFGRAHQVVHRRIALEVSARQGP
jgi:hypothetical protein